MLLGIRCALTAFFVVLWWLSQKWIGSRALAEDGTIGDFAHRLTDRWYASLRDHPRRANALLVASSLVIDAVGLYLIASALFGPTLRPLLGLAFLFTLRQLNQAITTLPAPEGMIWRHPGVPSIFVTYGVTNDLFFSGHTALAVYGALEIAWTGGGWWNLIGAAIILFEVGTVLLLRAHWTMDIFAGIVTALLTGEYVRDWAPHVDAWFASLLNS